MEEEEVFEDAMEEVGGGKETSTNLIEGEIPLGQGLQEAQIAIDHFFNNEYDDAKQVSEKYCERSIYHALGTGTFHYLKAVMTFEQEHVEKASQVLSQSVATIDKYRKKVGLGESLGKMVRRQDYDSYTEVEVHAELVFAECLLLKAMLTVCEDETLVSFVKAGLKVRQCYLSFKECFSILQQRDFSKDQYKVHFEGGVRLGVGTFNLLMSMLPARVTKLLEFVGFSGSRELGLRELLAVYRQEHCLRQFCATLILLGYHLFLTTNMGKPADCDIRLVEEILKTKLAKYPKGAFFLFFKGRAELISGRCESATKWYTLANNSQMSWPQFQHVGCWELFWSACYRCLWSEAIVHADRLLRESRWSPCLYAYLKAALYCQLSSTQQLTAEQLVEQEELMAQAPRLKQRIAGKSIPMEKYVIKKAEKFKNQGGSLMLPALELVYLWHGFSVIGEQYHLVEKFFLLIDEAQTEMKSSGKQNVEDDCLLLLLRGMCLKHMSSPLQAEECFREVLSQSSQLTLDKYLAPYATFELALLLLEQGDLGESSSLLDKAKSYKDYCLQNRLHFRIHAAQTRIKQGSAETSELPAKESFSSFTNLQPIQDINPQI